MEGQPWFGRVAMGVAPDAPKAVLAELIRMLDAVSPAGWTPSAVMPSTAATAAQRTSRSDWRNVDRPDHDVELIISDEAVVFWLGTQEHVYPNDATPDRPWTTVIVDAAAAIIRGQYTVKQTLRWGHVARSHLLDNVTGRRLSETGTLLALVPGPSRRQRTSVDFGCRA
ncbi:MAG: hypothetical protein JWN87_1485 [Frankiales bacterium]|nr:hypothetical protein [Frankiales bacterium]